MIGTREVRCEEVEKSFKVTFVSTELVYLNGGRADGLFVGARPTVWHNGASVAEIEILHLAEHSSAGRVVGQEGSILVGDLAKISLAVSQAANSGSAATPIEPSTVPEVAPSATESATRKRRTEPPTNVSGSIGLLYSVWDDRGDADLDYSQGRGDVDLRIDRLWTPGLMFRLRTSGRQDIRTQSGGDISGNSWISRIVMLAFEYRSERSPVALSVGRINPARVGAIGRLDGGSFEYRLTNRVRMGAFAGANSQWQYTDHRTDLQTYGWFAGYRRGTGREFLIDQTISTVGQYHGTTASREAIFAQGRVMQPGVWNFSHSVEVDVNRGWRRTATNGMFDLTSVFLQSQLNLSRAVMATATYDTRTGYRNYETRDIADSIFDDRTRQGVRAQMDFMLPSHVSISVGSGVRTVSGEADRTYSYNGALRKQGIFNAQTAFNANGLVFQGETTDGYNLNASLGQGFRQRDWISLGVGLYSYTLTGETERRINRRIELSGRVGISQALSINALGQLSDGDDTRGRRIEGGLSYQF